MSQEKIQALERMAAELASKIAEMTTERATEVASRKLYAVPENVVGSGTFNSSACNNFDFYLNSCDDNIYGGSSGDTGFVILCSAIVLMMTIPGLGLYYGGMVKVKNVLSTVMQAFSIVCLITFLYMCLGYSLAFGPINNPGYLNGASGHSSLFYGDASRFWFWGMNPASYNQLAPTIPESVYALYQLTFAIITCALICGSFADRMKYGSMLVFMGLWHIGVYCPVAHSCWHLDGFLNQAGLMDFAGGNVVHISSGIAGLVSTLVIGNRKGFGKERFEPHNILLTFVGTSMLWVGWYGFNAGSAVAANSLAGQALLNTQIATSVAALSWMFVEWGIRKKPSVLGMLSGAVAGLVAITPACGWVDQTGAFFSGLFAGPWCYGGAQLKHVIGYDDALDAFGVHATGGILGGLLTGFFATSRVWGPYVTLPGSPAEGGGYGPTRFEGVFYSHMDDRVHGADQLRIQAYAISCTILYTAAATWVILKLVDLTMGLRVSEEHEDAGLDSSLHGESIVQKIEEE
jgi:Amt family ammonium transporter